MPPSNQNPNPWHGPGQTPPAQPNYDFFLNPAPAPKQPLLAKFNKLGGGSLKKRLIIVAGGGLGLVILLIIISSFFGGGHNLTPFVTLAQDQNELVRVAIEATGQAGTQTTKNLDQTVALSLTSDQQQTIKYLKGNGDNVGTAQLNATKNTATDQKLTAATADSNFDPVFVQVIQTGLQSYINDLKTANLAAGPKGKTLLQSEFNSAELMLSQANSTASSLQG